MRKTALFFVAAAVCALNGNAQIAGSYLSRTVAGVFPIGDGGPATSALLELPQAVAAAADGTVYIADAGNGLIRKISKGVITTVAGYNGYVYDLRLDAAGNLYIATGDKAYQLTPAGKINVVAGNGSTTGFGGDGGPAISATFAGIYAIAVDSANNLYICDANNNRIRKVTPDGIVKTIAGNGKGFAGDGGPASGALFDLPRNIALDTAGNIYVNDYNNNRVRKISTDGTISTLAGSNICCSSPDGGPAKNVYLVTGPVTTDPSGNVYVYDYVTSRIRQVTPNGNIQPFAGDGNEGFAGDGNSAVLARFSRVAGLATDAQSNVYIADANNERVRLIASGSGFISTIAGGPHFAGDGAAATKALLHRPAGVVSGSDGTIYFTDTVNHRVRKIATDGTISTIAGTGTPAFSGDGGQATQAALSYPDSIAIDAAGNLFVVDQKELRVRKITPGGIISTVAGNGNAAFSVDNRGALQTGFAYLTGIAVDSTGNLYLSEQVYGKIKKVTPAGGLSTYAGTGDLGFKGDGGPATAAVLFYPGALTIDKSGNLFIADTVTLRIRKVDATTGAINTIAGNGGCCYKGDGGTALAAQIDPLGMVADGAGGVFFTDPVGVRYIRPDGTISRVSGGAAFGFDGDDQPAGPGTQYDYPYGIALNSTGEILIADTDNSRIRKLQPNDPARMDIVSGNNQNGITGTALNPTVVKVTGKSGLPASGVTVSFAVTAGTANLSVKSATTDATGQAGVTATPTKSGALTITATAGTLTATFNATITDPTTNSPAKVDIVSGNNQTGTTGTALSPIAVKVTGTSGSPLPGANVVFTVTAGAADFSSKTVVTDAGGQASVTPTPTKSGALTITATAGAFSVTFNATIKDSVITPSGDTPVIAQGGIGQNGFSVPPVQTISTGAITTIYGSNFMAAGSAAQVNAVAGGRLSTNFAGVCVTFGGVKAPIFAVATTQITVAVPTVSTGSVPVQVLRNCGDPTNQLSSNVLNASALGSSPEFLYLQANADGKNPVAAVSNADGAFIGVPGSIPGANLHPAKIGDILVVYVLGLGATSPAQQDGVPAPGVANAALPVSVSIGGVRLPQSDILYAGVSPSYIGLYQINLRVPAGVAPGNASMLLTVGTNQSPTGGYLTVQ